MKITPKIFSLPPYISTTWNHVIAIHMKETTLVVSLVDGDFIEIPGLKGEIIDQIFASHAAFIENEIAEDAEDQAQVALNKIVKSNPHPLLSKEGMIDHPFKIGFAALDGFGGVLQHNPTQSESPDIPQEVLQKIAAIAKIIALDDPNSLPKAEPHCNCMHCQISRAIEGETIEKKNPKIEEPQVADNELGFCQWDIEQTGEQMFVVTNRLDQIEKYSVYLGHPVGCTCGKSGCEHILAVLKS